MKQIKKGKELELDEIAEKHWEVIKTIVSEFSGNDFEDLIIGDLQKLSSYVVFYNELSGNCKDNIKNQFNFFIKKNGKYDTWRKSHAPKFWKENFSELSTCPYCNINSIMTIEKDKKGNNQAIFQFDHFYKKSTYPFLALSFYNLLPSCSTCNSKQCKGEKDFSIENNIHPYLDDFDSIAAFSPELNSNNLNTFLNPIHRRKNEIIPIKLRKRGSDADFKKAQNNAKIFKLEERYILYQDIITEILHKAQAYSSDYIQTLSDSFPTLFAGTDKIETLVWGTSLEKDDINARPLSKLQKDLHDEIRAALKEQHFKI